MKIHDKEYDDLCALQDSMYALDFNMSERSDLEDFKKAIAKMTVTVDNLLSLNDKDLKDKIAKFDKLYFQGCYDD